MNIRKFQLGFFIVFLVGILVLFFFIAKPYVGAVFLALITAALFKTINERIFVSFGRRKNLASFVSVLVVLAVIFVPLTIVGHLLVKESTALYSEVQNREVNFDSLTVVADKLEGFVQGFAPGMNMDLDRFFNVGPYLDRVLVWLSNNFSSFFSSALNLTLSAFLYVLCLFYLFRDGSLLTKNVLEWSPLFDTHDKLILNKISNAVTSVIRGQLMIGLIQGTLTGLGFWIFGIEHPVIWGAVAAIASLIPAIGTSFVNIPAIIFLFFTGQIFQAIGLAAWAIIAVGLIDNILGPYLINRGVKIHPFLVLISVLGGIGFFGPIGFIAGPVVLSLLFALLELYPIIMNGPSSAVNESTKL